ncbi:MAG: hypothetical protein J0I18_01295, partial [Actinobacteria bacterium]|nr:hypothetical protein [Actinomycetota bacterium]
MTASRVRPTEVADSRPSDTSIVPPLAKPAVAGRFLGSDVDEDGLPPTEAIDVVAIESAPPAASVRVYRLSFSTGETVEVLGSGLVG